MNKLRIKEARPEMMSDDKSPPRRHRNTVYDENIHPDLAIEVFSQGLDIPSVCAASGISKQTYHEWYNIRPEFREACDVGKALGEHWWDEQAKEHLVIVTEQGGDKTTFNDSLFKFTKKVNYKARENDLPTTNNFFIGADADKAKLDEIDRQVAERQAEKLKDE